VAVTAWYNGCFSGHSRPCFVAFLRKTSLSRLVVGSWVVIVTLVLRARRASLAIYMDTGSYVTQNPISGACVAAITVGIGVVIIVVE
jgi:hypothetical protein